MLTRNKTRPFSRTSREITWAGITWSSFFAQFSCINVFWAITPGHNFLAHLLARRKHMGFLAKKLLTLWHTVFFSVKAFTQLLRNFFEICHGNSTTMHFVDSLLFLVCQNDRSTFTKAKSWAIKINSYLSSASNCMRRLGFFFDLQWNEIDKWKTSKTFACVEFYSV